MNPLHRLILAAFGLLVFAAQAVAQETPVAAAADADVIAVYSEHVERRLLRAHVDRAAAAMSLVLKQDANKVTGTFISGHGPDLALEGEFADGTLRLESAGGGDTKVIFNGKLKDEGTLAGYVSGPMGDMKWTGERVKDKK